MLRPEERTVLSASQVAQFEARGGQREAEDLILMERDAAEAFYAEIAALLECSDGRAAVQAYPAQNRLAQDVAVPLGFHYKADNIPGGARRPKV